MVKSVLGVNHQGLRDWAIQRLTAFFMMIYSLGLIGYFMLHPKLSFVKWHGLFVMSWMKIMTLLFILAVLCHAWVGLWTVLTDYVKPFLVRIVLNICIFLLLTVCFFWGWLIVWSV